MEEKHLNEIKVIIENTINKVVNGKIDKLSAKLDAYIIEDTKWKETATPSLDVVKSGSTFFKVVKIILGWIVLVGSSIGAYLFIRTKL